MSQGTPAKALAREYIEAVGQKQLDHVAELLHPDLEFTMRELTHDKDNYLAALRRLAPIISHNEIKQILGGEDEVSVVYDFVTDTAAGAVPTVEVLTIEDGRIRTIHLVFERERWPEVLDELGRRASVTS